MEMGERIVGFYEDNKKVREGRGYKLLTIEQINFLEKLFEAQQHELSANEEIRLGHKKPVTYNGVIKEPEEFSITTFYRDWTNPLLAYIPHRKTNNQPLISPSHRVDFPIARIGASSSFGDMRMSYRRTTNMHNGSNTVIRSETSVPRQVSLRNVFQPRYLVMLENTLKLLGVKPGSDDIVMNGCSTVGLAEYNSTTGNKYASPQPDSGFHFSARGYLPGLVTKDYVGCTVIVFDYYFFINPHSDKFVNQRVLGYGYNT